eukprot:CAMPEP_0114498130 /NCGR_PEP_ID=MMETSP0109-20121206/6710_1 /TAXON_ID=29199 /ORGANISM="Chlorarachnion reptans, Strain CCCM449" /LENGTH=99 /DNA_ID=CAMNT_0001675591 /DNA_START=259 /DNA_END=558 /DNA_ORIENTATION=-
MDEKAITKLVQENTVVIFSKSYCPHCKRAKKGLTDIGVVYKALELDLREDGASIQETLQKMTGQKTVPNVWLKGKHLGGADDTIKAIKEGKFDPYKGSS